MDGRVVACSVLTAFALLCHPQPCFAVVGQAEEYDRFKEEDLEDFHDNILQEERAGRTNKSMEIIQAKEKQLLKTAGAESDSLKKEISTMKQEVLNLPKRDRFQMEVNGKYEYDTNVDRRPIHEEKDNSVFQNDTTALFDLSGRKTDLRFEVSGHKQWNYPQDIKDFWGAEERIRYRRKYIKKVFHSVQSRIARESSKTVEINEKKVRWDSQQNTAFNYSFSPKLALNTEFQAIHRIFTGEPFDQDSSRELSMAPSAFFNLTPKSRIFTGYRFAATEIESKTGNANAQEIHIGYFGRVSRKSSTSLDFAYSRQTPKAFETAKVNTITLGLGYIWQMTPKTQLTTQIIRSQQNSTSDAVSGTDNQVTKTDTHVTNTALTLSLNSRLNAKLTAILSASVSDLKTKVSAGADKDPETEQIGFPISLNATYFLYRWMSITMGYTFSYRLGNERADYYRSHLFQTAIRVIF